MPLTTALLVSLALGAGGDRMLLCRPKLAGDPALARPEAILEAGRTLGRDVLDYGVACESPAEAARAAGRAGLERAVSSVAAGSPEGSRYTLILTSAAEEELAWRTLQVPTGADPVAPLAAALRGLQRVAGTQHPAWVKPATWTLWVGGAISVAAGLVLGLQARDDARKADAATTPEDWVAADDAWRSHRTQSAVAYGVGAAALAAGTAIRFTF